MEVENEMENELGNKTELVETDYFLVNFKIHYSINTHNMSNIILIL